MHRIVDNVSLVERPTNYSRAPQRKGEYVPWASMGRGSLGNILANSAYQSKAPSTMENQMSECCMHHARPSSSLNFMGCREKGRIRHEELVSFMDAELRAGSGSVFCPQPSVNGANLAFVPYFQETQKGRRWIFWKQLYPYLPLWQPLLWIRMQCNFRILTTVNNQGNYALVSRLPVVPRVCPVQVVSTVGHVGLLVISPTPAVAPTCAPSTRQRR